MIKNERQYAITKEWVAKFEESIADLVRSPGPGDGLDPYTREITIRSQQSQLEDLRAEVAEYEALKAGRVRRVAHESFDEFPAALIKARIAAGLTQRQLAERLGLKEQQIQRYEATDYRSASLARVGEVVAALGLQARGDFRLPARYRAAAGQR
jgi:ribosome-binding protein aMBF1 (putative translation factor)